MICLWRSMQGLLPSRCQETLSTMPSTPPSYTHCSATSLSFGLRASHQVSPWLQNLTHHHSHIHLQGVFATWAPRLYHYYVQHLGPLFKSYPRLHRNFLNSVFACATFNFGPQTCCFPHKDSGNLSFGWCAITALGKFDPTCGGHLILWDLKLVIEFPPGSTILIPSATIRHSNIAIRPHETRYSFTQYTAGGLFRWVDHGYQTEASYQAGWSKGRKAEEEETNGRRWAEGVKMFSTFDELHAMHSAL